MSNKRKSKTWSVIFVFATCLVLPVWARDAQKPMPHGKYVLRAATGLGDGANYEDFCTSFVANLNEFRHLDFDTCDPRLSPAYPRFSRPKWDEIPLDMDMARKILTNRPSVGFDRWVSITGRLRANGEVKMWRVRVDLLKDGNLNTLVRLDHSSDGARPYCSFLDSKQMIVEISNPVASQWYTPEFLNYEWLGGDMIYDSVTKRYFVLNWNRYGRSLGGGIALSNIGATASVMVSSAVERGIAPVCWIDWVPTRKPKPAGQQDGQ